MKMYKKNITILCLIFLFLIQGTGFASDINYSAFITSLGILPEQNGDYITRGELSYIITKMGDIYVDNDDKSTYFSDVLDSNKYINEINAAAKNGFMKAFSDKNFEPDYYATKTDVAYAFVALLGYSDYAEMRQGYPNGYIYVAEELNLFKGTVIQDYIDKDDMSQIIYNTLNAEKMEKSFSDKNSFVKTDSSILDDTFNIYKISGIVTANGNTNIETQNDQSNNIIINGIEYSGIIDDSLLGYQVTAFVKKNKNGDEEIVYIEVLSKNRTIEVSGLDVISVGKDKKITYSDNNKNKYLQLSDTASYIYNDKVTYSLSLNIFQNKSVYLTFIDNNDDGKIDVVKILKYENIIYDGITNDNIIVGKYGESLDLDKCDSYTLTKDNKNIEISELMSWDVLSYTVSEDGNIVKIICTREPISAKITGTEEDNGILYSLDGEKFRLSNSYEDLVLAGKASKFSVGMSGTFCIDAYGRIAGYNADNTAKEFEYGFLVKVIRNAEEEEKTMFRIYTADGELAEFYPAKRITIDQNTYKENVDFTNELITKGSYRQLIKYTLNDDGLIKKIDTAKVNLSKGETNDNSLTLDVAAPTDGQIYNAGVMGGLYYIDNDSLIFKVPSEEDSDYADLYSVGRRNTYCKTGNEYYFDAYDVDTEYNAAVLVENGEVANSDFEKKYILVSKINEIFDEETEEVTKKIIGFSNGSPYEAIARNNEVVSNLQPGDVIMCSYDSRKHIKEIKTVLDISENPNTFVQTNTTRGGTYGYHGDKRYLFGVVTDVISNRFKAGILNDKNQVISDSVFYYIVPTNLQLICFDRSSNDVTIFDKGKATDLITGIYNENETARIFIGSSYSSLLCAYLYIN